MSDLILEHGAVVIGITCVISSGVALILEIGMIADWDDIKLNFKDRRMRDFVYPLLIVSLALSFVYLVFSIVLLKGIQEVIDSKRLRENFRKRFRFGPQNVLILCNFRRGKSPRFGLGCFGLSFTF